MINNDIYSLHRLTDRIKIQDVIYRWCHSVDRLDFEGMRAVFHAGATDDHVGYLGSVDELIQWIKDRHLRISFSSHHVSNILIEFPSDEMALVESYVFVVRRHVAHINTELYDLKESLESDTHENINTFSSARYIDQFARKCGEWRIMRRRVASGWRRVFKITDDDLLLDMVDSSSRRDKSDIYYIERTKLFDCK